MKLLFCPRCQDIRKLQMEPDVTTCNCGDSWGFYKSDGWHAVIGHGMAIGMDNNSIAYAIKERLNGVGQSLYLSAWLMATDHKTIEYGGKEDGKKKEQEETRPSEQASGEQSGEGRLPMGARTYKRTP